MALAGRSLNKYELEKKTKLGWDSIYDDWIPKMWAAKWIEIDPEEYELRRGKTVEYYRLTDLGLCRAIKLNPDLLENRNIRRRVDPIYHDFEKREKLARTKGYERRISKLTQDINQILKRRTAEPGWEANLKIRADNQGDLKYTWSYGLPVRRHRKPKQS